MKKFYWNRGETPSELHGLLAELAAEYPVAEAAGDVLLRFLPGAAQDACDVSPERAGVVEITYSTRVSACRGVGRALAGLSGAEKCAFPTFGVMFDCSRNAVIRISHLKRWIRRLAMLGYNTVMLYTEDTYELPGEPYFGFLRGAYSITEIQELDRYGASFGVELIGCIQTLGHLEQVLKWQAMYQYRDTPTVLLVDEEASYRLIGKMIDFWSEALSSRRIHVGMDETHDLGRGVFMNKHGFECGFDIFNRHLARVNQICVERGLKPMIWSDMYFRMGSATGDYYDKKCVIPPEVGAAIPRNVDLVYWDYYNDDEAFYREWIKRHRELGFEPVMASGIWTWVRVWYDHSTTRRTVEPCLAACRGENLREFIFTMWGDDGGYCDLDSAQAGLAWAAEHVHLGRESEARTAAMFRAVTGGDYAMHLAAAKLQLERQEPGCEELLPRMMIAPNTLWDDPLLGIIHRESAKGDPGFWPDAADTLRRTIAEIEAAADENAAGDFGHALNLCRALLEVIEFITRLRTAYRAGDRRTLSQLRHVGVENVVAALEALDESWRRQWMARNKCFGYEVVQLRMAGKKARYREAARRIGEFLDGQVDSIPELDAEIEPFGKIASRYRFYATGCLNV